MRKFSNTLNRSQMAWAVALAAMSIGQAHAQSAGEPAAEKAPAAETGTLNLDAVVVTGTSTRASKMKQSVSISSISAEQVSKTAPANAADILRTVPGIRAESTGGDSNANVNIRGLPSPDGGARYVQFQEDGLPVLLFGDIMFGSADSLVRADYSLGRIEAIRGGSASVATSNAPGGIINFMSKKGDEKGGAIGLTKGLTHDQTRYDFEYGGSASEATRFYIGGFYRTGETVRKMGAGAEKGGQIRANITHDLDRGGYVRLNLKSLDDTTPMILPVPMRANGDGSLSAYPGMDPRKGFGSPIGLRDEAFDAQGGRVSTQSSSGVSFKSDSIGAELLLNTESGWQVDNKFRVSSTSGSWFGITSPSKVGTIAALSQELGARHGGAAAYSGVNATTGAAANGSDMAFVGHAFNTKVKDLGNMVNDLKVSNTFELGGSKLNTAFGLFHMRQAIAMDWVWSSYLLSLNSNPTVINIVDSAGRKVGPGSGFSNGASQWGNCCVMGYDLEFSQTAPYASLNWESGPVIVDGGVRFDRLQASGSRIEGGATKAIDYSVSKPAFSLGGNYSVDKNLAFFARGSKGTRFNADRLVGGPAVVNGGGLSSAEAAVDSVEQLEGGVKWRSGGLNLFATLFDAKTRFSSYAPADGAIASTFSARGLELEAGYRSGGFGIAAGATYTDAKIKKWNGSTSDPFVGNTPRRQADWVFQVAPSYSIGKFTVGGAVIGTTKSYAGFDNRLEMPGYVVVNASLGYEFNDEASFGLSVNNLFNKLGITEVEGDFSARTTQARSVLASLKYRF